MGSGEPRSSSSAATGLLVIDVPRSAWTTVGTPWTRWRASVGSDRYDQMKATLHELVQADLGVTAVANNGPTGLPDQ